MSTNGIYLGISKLDSTRSVLLTSSSSLAPFALNDITFIIPSFVSSSLAQAVYDPNQVVTPSISLESEEKEILAVTPEVERASHLIIQDLRKLDTKVEEARMNLIQLGITELYRLYTATGNGHQVPDKITTKAALATVYHDGPLPQFDFNNKSTTSTEFNKTLSNNIYKLATHQILMESPLHFICDPINHRSSSTFTLRKVEELTSFNLVREWVRERDERLINFAKKAVRIAQWGEARSTSTPDNKVELGGKEKGLSEWNLPKGMNWNESDLEIIKFLRLSLTSQRLLQLQPYLAISPSILKLVEEYQRLSIAPTSSAKVLDSIITSTDSTSSSKSTTNSITRSDTFNRERIMSFLTSIGIVPPWENWAVHSYQPLVARSIASSTDSLISKALESTYNELPIYNDGLNEVRKDFGSLKVFTIDDAGAMELDDGISIEECIPSIEPEAKSWWIHVHVADPTSVLSPNHEVAELAKKRYQTIYLPERTFPMLPEWFIEKEKLSLGSATKKDGTGEQKVLTFSTRVNELGDRLDSKVQAGIVRDVRRLTYAAVDDILGFERGPKPVVLSLLPSSTIESKDDPTSPTLNSARHTDDSTLLTDSSAVADLKQLHTLAKAVLKQRAANSLFWNFPASTTSVSPSLSHQFNTDSKPHFFSSHPAISLTLPIQNTSGQLTFSQTIVSEFMIAANRTAAKFCAERKIPVPFRSQIAPKSNPSALKKILDLRDPDTGLVRGEDVLKYDINFDAAVTTTYPLPHWPMGIHDQFGYVKVTSPLRRYSDMLCHWQIKSALARTSTLADSTSITSSDSINSSASHQLVPSLLQHQVAAQASAFEQSDKLQKNLDKSGNSFWAHYLIKSKLELSPGDDPIADEVLSNLTCLGLRAPNFSLSEGYWSQRVLIMELGIRGQLELGDSGVEGAQVGERVKCKIKEIILSENSRCWVTLRK